MVLDVWRRCWLYSAYWQWCVVATLCWLVIEFGASVLVPKQLSFLVVVVVVELVGPEILRCWEWVLDMVRRLCVCSVIVEPAVVHCLLLPLGYCQ